jgi:hypothetical protein
VTGKTHERTWRTIWMNQPRDYYRHHLRQTKSGIQ